MESKLDELVDSINEEVKNPNATFVDYAFILFKFRVIFILAWAFALIKSVWKISVVTVAATLGIVLVSLHWILLGLACYGVWLLI